MNVGNGKINIEVKDPDCEWNNGKWKLISDNGKLIIEETEQADFSLNINGLSAIIFGGCEIDDINYRSWGSINEVQKTAVLQLFPPVIPSLYELF